MTEKPFGLAVKALLRDSQGRYLLIRRSLNSRFWPGKWDLHGGKVDPGESFDVAMIREAEEETGLTIQIEGIVGAVQFDLPHCLVAVLVMKASAASGDFRLSSEHGGYEWTPRHALPQREFGNALDDLVMRFAQDDA